jgi:hypothetical protein
MLRRILLPALWLMAMVKFVMKGGTVYRDDSTKTAQ